MKTANTSLVLYTVASVFSVLLCCLHLYEWALYPKALVVPFIALYYYQTNHHSFKSDRLAIFALAWFGDVYIMLGLDSSFVVSDGCFILFYLLILRYIAREFVGVRFKKRDALPIAVVLIFITALLIMVMNLGFANEEKFYYLFLLHGIVLAVMGKLAIVNYIGKGSRQTISAVLMWTCFLLSDIFYMLYHFYVPFPMFEVINVSTQVLSYFFMARYFLRMDYALQN